MSKGTKPRKPPSKKVVSLLDSLKRKVGQREPADRFLIVCEDEKSSPNYFRALKQRFALSATVVSSGHYSQPIQVVERALATKEQSEKDADDLPPFKEIWCVIDGDYGPAINNARAKAKANGIKMAISTPCFEYWVMLHFEDNASPAENCDLIIHVLKKHLPDYEKGSCKFDKIVGNAQSASKRAKRLRKLRVEVDLLPENHNPCSEIYLLIEALIGTQQLQA